ncbi:hypothetical protein ABZ754_27625 [Micromonospora purpureochromogenes]|uniref:hypothetical protein n=1 Tax=Micromonospora purpureochromogenes TaxID=47872 RepID=UPI0033F670BC
MTVRASASVLALLLTLTGCGVARDLATRDAATPSGPSAPDELRQAAQALDRGPYSFQFRTPTTIGAGAVDGRDGWLRIRVVGGEIAKARVTFEVLHRDGQHLVRSNPLTEDRWTRLDMTKVSPARRAALERFGDPAHAEDLLAGVGTAERNGERGYRGTLDLTRATEPAASRLIDDAHLRSLTPEQTGAVPFEATVDSQRRLLGLRFTLPAAGGRPEQPSEISYSGHGFKPDLSAPFDGKIGPAPAEVYEFVNS